MQIPVNEKKGLTFARGLRSILRHDPDKIMVGEIRDEETAQIAIQSALTGHLVFTTVHANNVFDVLGRFLNMKSISTTSCRRSTACWRSGWCGASAATARVSRRATGSCWSRGLDPSVYGEFTFHEGSGCIECNGTGFYGRTAVSEILDLSDHPRADHRAPAGVGDQARRWRRAWCSCASRRCRRRCRADDAA